MDYNLTLRDVESSRIGGQELSAREIEVLQLAADAKTNAEIGRDLWISINTVKRHFDRMSWKTGIPNRAGQVAYGFRRGLLK